MVETGLLFHYINRSPISTGVDKYKIAISDKCRELFQINNKNEIRNIIKSIITNLPEYVIEYFTDVELKRKCILEYEEFKTKNIGVSTCFDSDFSEFLQYIYDPPFIIYYKGRLPEKNKISIAVIGSRKCTEYGRCYAEIFGRELAKNDFQVISGMARGIDCFAQWAAVKEQGSSFAVLGSGVDICYPKENRYLYDELCEKGGVLSEYPPGTEPLASNFPRRNRIIAGISNGVMIVEANYHSGSLITGQLALEQGKDIFALPGRANDICSAGCIDFIKSGAIPVTNPSEIITFYDR